MNNQVRLILATLFLCGCGGDDPAVEVVTLGTDTTPVAAVAPDPVEVVSPQPVVCNHFDVETARSGDLLGVILETDLPEHAIVMVSVSRSYLEVGSNVPYSCDYFTTRSTVGEWRKPHPISIADEVWRTALKEKQAEMLPLGLGFDVATVSQHIDVRLVVPVNQPDAAFGPKNENLIGEAVRKTRLCP